MYRSILEFKNYIYARGDATFYPAHSLYKNKNKSHINVTVNLPNALRNCRYTPLQ